MFLKNINKIYSFKTYTAFLKYKQKLYITLEMLD